MTPEYTQAIRRLAVETAMPREVATRMEQEMERAFEARSEQPPLTLPRSRRVRAAAWAMAAAAAVALLVLGAVFARARGPVTQNNVTSQSASKMPAADSARTPVEGGLIPPATAMMPGPQRGTAVRKHAPAVVRPAGFVPVPAAAGLPQFESGMIVRVSLPVTALPAYGVDLSPAFTEASVEADVLVAQDGFARAIRLVNTSRSQQ